MSEGDAEGWFSLSWRDNIRVRWRLLSQLFVAVASAHGDQGLGCRDNTPRERMVFEDTQNIDRITGLVMHRV